MHIMIHLRNIPDSDNMCIINKDNIKMPLAGLVPPNQPRQSKEEIAANPSKNANHFHFQYPSLDTADYPRQLN